VFLRISTFLNICKFEPLIQIVTNFKAMKISNILSKLILKINVEIPSTLLDIAITNIATLEDLTPLNVSKSPIILSIVNIEEDRTLKNQSVYLKETNDKTNISRYKNPTQHLILSVLFSSYSQESIMYLNGIEKLNLIINYFQQYSTFYYKNDDSELIYFEEYISKSETDKPKYAKITFETTFLGMEQLNQMWSYLGSKYMPSILFRMRLYPVQVVDVIDEKVIKEVKINLWENDKNDTIGLIETV
jgi:hypothetical protein